MTMCVLLLIDIQAMQTWEIAGFRIGLNVLGGAIALACVRLLWPRGEAVRLRRRLAGLLKAHALAARTLAGDDPGQTARGRRRTGHQEGRRRGRRGRVGHRGDGPRTRRGRDRAHRGAARRGHPGPRRAHHADLGAAGGPGQRRRPGSGGAARRWPIGWSGGAEAVQENGPYEPRGDVDQKLSDLRKWLGKLALDEDSGELDDRPGRLPHRGQEGPAATRPPPTTRSRPSPTTRRGW